MFGLLFKLNKIFEIDLQHLLGIFAQTCSFKPHIVLQSTQSSMDFQENILVPSANILMAFIYVYPTRKFFNFQIKKGCYHVNRVFSSFNLGAFNDCYGELGCY